MTRTLLTATLLFILHTSYFILPIHAQTAPNVIQNSATPSFPSDILFELALAEGHDVTAVFLTFVVQKFSCLDADVQVPVELNGNRAEWNWVLTRSGNLPPGAQVEWYWTLVDSSGARTQTERQTLTFTDPRYNWREVEAEGINLYWYEGNSVGPKLLEASVESLHRLESDMGIELQEEVNVYIYGSSDDMRDALLYVQAWAGGVAFSEFNTILMGVPPRIVDSWGVDVVPHELAHLVIGQYGRSCVGGSRPTWLEEGLAVFAEGEPSEETVSDIQTGLRNDSFEPLRSLNGSFSADHTQAGLSYSQSYSVVNYLIDTYGAEKMQQLIVTLANGEDYDAALTTVYGFDIDGLEAEWRTAIGARPRLIPPTPTPLLAKAVPTYEPSGLPQSVPTPAPAPNEAESEENGRRLPLCGLGLLPLLLLAMVFKQSVETRGAKLTRASK